MPYCSVRWCGINNMTNDYKKENITFHRFPKSPEAKVKWVNAIRLRKELWYPSYTSVICSRHFKDDCYDYFGNNKRRLKDDAIPTERLYLPKVTYYPRRQQHRCTVHPECGSGSSAMRVSEKIRDGKYIIGKVYSFLEAEFRTLNAYYQGKIDLTPLADILGRTAEATGVGKRTVTAILRKETYFKCDKHRNRSLLRPSVLQHNFSILQRQGKSLPNLHADEPINILKTESAFSKPSKGAPQQLVILAPVEKNTDVNHVAEICIEYGNPEKRTTPSVIVRKGPDTPIERDTLIKRDTPKERDTPIEKDKPIERDTPIEKDTPTERDTPAERDTQGNEDSAKPTELVLYTYDKPSEGEAAPEMFDGFSYATEVETITVEPDIEKLCLQHEPSRYIPAEAPITCDVQIQTDPVKRHDRSHGSVQQSPQIIPQEEIRNEITDLALDEINNNIQDDLDEPPLQIVIKTESSGDELECMEVPSDDVFWQPTDVEKRYVPRDEFRDYYTYIGNLI